MKLSSFILTLLITSSSILNAAFREDVTLHVPSEYATIHDALYDLDEKTISKDITVTIQVADGSYSLDEEILIDHPYSNRLKILGNTSNPSSCVLNFGNGTNGFNFNTSISEIDGFSLQGSTSSGYAIYANGPVKVNIGSNIHIDGFYYGVYATGSCRIGCTGITIRNCGFRGIFCQSSSTVIAHEADVSGCGESGVVCSFNATLFFDNGTSNNNSAYGLFAHRMGYIRAANATASGNSSGNFSPNANSLGNNSGYIEN